MFFQLVMIIFKKIVTRFYDIFLKSIFYYLYFIYYRYSFNVNNRLNIKKNNDEFIVSLTTFPVRIDKLWLTIESLLRQSVKPDRIIIWLYEGEFDGESSLPKELLEQKKRGLEIRFCNENIMPHKKYYYTMLEFPEANIITIDDDKIYPKNLLSKLIKYHKKNPNTILSTISRKIEVKNNKLLPYKYWKQQVENIKPSYSYLPIGAGSVLYPKNSLHHDVLDIETFSTLSPRADDLWLKIMAIKKNTKSMSIAGEFMLPFTSILIKNDRELMSSNLRDGNNDIVLKNLITHYKIDISSFLDKAPNKILL